MKSPENDLHGCPIVGCPSGGMLPLVGGRLMSHPFPPFGLCPGGTYDMTVDADIEIEAEEMGLAERTAAMPLPARHLIWWARQELIEAEGPEGWEEGYLAYHSAAGAQLLKELGAEAFPGLRA